MMRFGAAGLLRERDELKSICAVLHTILRLSVYMCCSVAVCAAAVRAGWGGPGGVTEFEPKSSVHSV